MAPTNMNWQFPHRSVFQLHKQSQMDLMRCLHASRSEKDARGRGTLQKPDTHPSYGNQ
jgi:hypothetical protein